VVFLTAASQRSRRARLVTGAVLPVFNHPLKLAGELAMLDAISNGRLDIGFARAFLPYEFRHFGVSMDESIARFEEGVEQVRMLLESENVSSQGRFHQFSGVTSLPRPTQYPRPPFWLAAVGTPQSFERAGTLGYNLMAIPGVGSSPSELVQIYREAWRAAGHKGKPQIMLATFMTCHEDRERAIELAKPRIERHFQSIAEAMAEHAGRQISPDYKNYDRMIEKVRAETFETQLQHHAAFVGTPADVLDQLHDFDRAMGGVDHASLQVNYNDMPYADAEQSVRLFGEKVMPHFASR
jgi:alkanesulfonate monooxygenase SsuD/methylene tetrahydromethanopterin reductase-like flavin-dependent oxidoreductase (luciferase family)